MLAPCGGVSDASSSQQSLHPPGGSKPIPHDEDRIRVDGDQGFGVGRYEGRYAFVGGDVIGTHPLDKLAGPVLRTKNEENASISANVEESDSHRLGRFPCCYLLFGLVDLLLGTFHQGFACIRLSDGIGNSANKLRSGADTAVGIYEHHRNPGFTELIEGLLRTHAAVGDDDRRFQTCDGLDVKNVSVFCHHGAVMQLLFSGGNSAPDDLVAQSKSNEGA